MVVRPPNIRPASGLDLGESSARNAPPVPDPPLQTLLPAGATCGPLTDYQPGGARPLAAVAIPARDETARIAGCLEALRCQWSPQTGRLEDRFAVVVVVNGTSDATAYEVVRWARAHPRFPLLAVDVRFADGDAHVGSARRYALALAGDLLGDDPRGLLFSTDADSRLRHHAVARALAESARVDAFGAHIVTDGPDPSRVGRLFNRHRALRAALRHRLFPEPHERSAPHGVFGGAGFGVRLGAYRAIGGLPPLPYDEDQALRAALRCGGFAVSYPSDVVVTTSTRLAGRVPWGMARQLSAWAADEAAGRWPLAPSGSALRYRYRRKAAMRAAHAAASDPEPFELVWRRWWESPAIARAVAALFPPLPLPAAIRSLERALEHVEPVAASPVAAEVA